MRFLFFVLFLLSYITVDAQKILTGRVVAISDGDTFTLLTANKEQIKIRLYGIDCPEKKQDFGTKAKQFTSDQCFGKTVTVQIRNNDRYGRKIGIVTLPDRAILNKKLLLAGLAWHYTYYDNSEELANLEMQARRNKVGIWSSGNAIAPWDFRKGVKTGVSKTRTAKVKQQCSAIAQSGKRCRHNATIGDRCWQHQL